MISLADRSERDRLMVRYGSVCTGKNETLWCFLFQLNEVSKSRDHSSRHRPFPIGGPLEPSLHRQQWYFIETEPKNRTEITPSRDLPMVAYLQTR